MDHELMDEGLRRAFATPAFANMNNASSRGCVLQNLFVDQIIDQQNRGGLNGLHGFERQ
jgi:hypothetical protein